MGYLMPKTLSRRTVVAYLSQEYESESEHNRETGVRIHIKSKFMVSGITDI